MTITVIDGGSSPSAGRDVLCKQGSEVCASGMEGWQGSRMGCMTPCSWMEDRLYERGIRLLCSVHLLLSGMKELELGSHCRVATHDK